MKAYEWYMATTENGREDAWEEHELTPVKGTRDSYTDETGEYFKAMHDGRYFNEDGSRMLTDSPAAY